MSDPEPGEYKRGSASPVQRSRSRSKRSASNSNSSYHSRKSVSIRRSYSRSRSRSRSYRSRSRSRSHHRRRSSHRSSRTPEKYAKNGRRGYSRSRSRSHSRGRGRDSRSPMSSRKRHIGDRLDPPRSKCLGIFGLSLYTTESDLRSVFSRYGRIESVNVVIDQKTGRSRGFGFCYFDHEEDAEEAKERANGMELDGRRIRVDYSITKRAHTPTPGVYVGRPYRAPPREDRNDRYDPRDRHDRDRYRDEYSRRDSYRRSPSPHYRRRSPSPYYRDSHRDRSPYRNSRY